MKRVKSGRRSRMFMGRLLAGMTAAALFVSSFAVPGNAGIDRRDLSISRFLKIYLH